MKYFKISIEAEVIITGLVHLKEMTVPVAGDKIIATNYGNAISHIEIRRGKKPLFFIVKAQDNLGESTRAFINNCLQYTLVWINPNGSVNEIFTPDFLKALLPWAEIKGHSSKDKNRLSSTFIIDDVKLLPKNL